MGGNSSSAWRPDPVRIGIVGCGRHATSVLLPALVHLNFDLAATCARRLSTAQAAAARFGARAAYDSVAEMIRREELDAVVACVPPPAYGAVIGECVDAGLPVFAEKPGVLTPPRRKTWRGVAVTLASRSWWAT